MAQGGGIGSGLGKFTELRQRLLFVLGALIIYRIGCFVPVPGVNPDAMMQMMQQQGGGIVDMFNMFSGGALHRFSIFALNVMPYISASIVMQLAVHIFPALKALQKEGESGRRKITQYSRIGAVLLSVVQGAAREHVEHVHDTAALRLHQRKHGIGIDARHRHVAADAVDEQCPDDEQKTLAKFRELAHSAREVSDASLRHVPVTPARCRRQLRSRPWRRRWPPHPSG